MRSPAALLERYVEAKDRVRPHLMQEIYAPDAVLTYSIATDSIAFPARVSGREAITKTLVADFALSYTRCKTFYVCDAPPPAGATVVLLPWLVLMSESAGGRMRAGRGCYRWSFAAHERQGAVVTAMHIHIDKMDPVEDPGGGLLAAAQGDLPYPWLTPDELWTRFTALAQRDRALGFLHGLREPFDPLSSAALAASAR
jgi:hypothetical protein